jgi:glycosyltransferase involved in cell wall biosynthesis
MFTDLYPDKPKILFIGNPGSSHVQGWINLLMGGEFNLRLFACTDGCPPNEWKVKTHIISKSLPEGLDAEWRETWWPMPEEWYAYNRDLNQYNEERGKSPKFHKFFDKLFYRIFKIHPLFPQFQGAYPQSRTASTEDWLAEVIKFWQPDIIHTIGLDEGTEFYFRVRNQYELGGYGKWIIKVFGGSDVAFKIFDKENLQVVSLMFSFAKHVLFDNKYYPNILIKEKALEPEKLCPLTPTPGSGGIDVEDLNSRWDGPTSCRRMIVWPKSYESTWSKALPVLFALRAVWDRIQPCEVYMLATNPEMLPWISSLPEDMRIHLHVFSGVPRKMALDVMLKSRVVLAPSLIDGVPNVVYEAMACGAIPIVSPLPTIVDVFTEKNVVFAENLKQTDIEQALLISMTDDVFVDECATRNVELVKELADIKLIQKKVIAYYKSLVDFKE